MELRQLRYFVTTAEKLSFSEAARELNISQSTLSQQISSLEGELGTQLLVRNKHTMQLTDTGQALLPHALKTLSEADSCIDRMNDVMKLKSGEINIGATYTFSPLLQETVTTYMSQYPGIKLNIFCKSMEELIEMLKHRQIDVALSHKPLRQDDSIESHVLFDSELCAVMSTSHPLAGKRSLTLRDIEQHPVCLPAQGMQARYIFDRILSHNNDVRLNVRLEINDVHILLDLAARSRLITFLSRASLINHPNVIGISIDSPEVAMQGSFHIMRDTYMKHATRAFLKLLCENKSFSIALLNFL